MTTRLPEKLVRKNLYNWLGFGNLNGRYWFLGREETDAFSPCEKVNGLQDYYEIRSEFGHAEDFVDVWENAYGRSVADGTNSITTRHFQAAFLLAFDGNSPTGRNPQTGMSKTKSYLFTEKRFGRLGSNHFSGEVYPLKYRPKNPASFDPYRHIWGTPHAYKQEVRSNRIDLFQEQIEVNPDVEVVISYAKTEDFVEPLKNRFDHEELGRWPANKSNEFKLMRCYINEDQSIILVDSPFFGNGRVGYSEITAVAPEIEALIEEN